MNKTNLAQQIDAKIKESENILIIGHNSPDPDALSSAIALQEIISNHYGKKVQAICERTPQNLRFIPGYGDVIHNSLLSQIKMGGYDLLILVDFNQWHMSSRKDNEAIREEIFMQQIPIILIDHHSESGCDIKSDLYFHENPTSASANVHTLFHKEIGAPISPKVAEHLLIGILADTNRFRYKYGAKTEATILRIAADLVEQSERSIEELSVELSRINSEQLDIIGTYLMNIEQIDEDTVYSTLSEEDISANQLNTKVLGDASTYITNDIITYVDSVKRGFIVYPRLVEEDTFTVRFRSNNPEYPVNHWAEELGGGGHPQSAAALVKALSIEEAVERVIRVIEKY